MAVAVVLGVPALFLALFAYYPLAAIIGESWRDAPSVTAPFVEILAKPLVLRALGNSALQASLTALLVAVVGVPAGYILARYDFPARKLMRVFALVPFFLPSIVVVVAFVSLYGEGGFLGRWLAPARSLSEGLSGILAVNLFFNLPLVMVLTATSLEETDAEQLEAAALLGGSRWLHLRRFVWPQARSGVLAGALIAFVYAFLGYTVPLIVGGATNRTVEVEIFSRFYTYNDFAGAAALALVQLLVLAGLAAAFLRWLILHRPSGLAIRYPPPRKRLWAEASRTESVVVTAGLLLVFGFLFLPIGALGASAFLETDTGALSIRSFQILFSPATEEVLYVTTFQVILNTLFFACLTALLVVTLGILGAWGMRRLGPRGRWGADALLFIPLAISPITIAMGLYLAWAGRSSLGLAVWPLMLLAHVLVAFPLVVRTLVSSLDRVPEDAVEAAQTLGSHAPDRLFRVELPLIRRGLMLAAAVGFATSLGEFAANNLLYPIARPYTTMTVAIYRLLVTPEMSSDKPLREAAAAASLLLILLSAAVFFLLTRLPAAREARHGRKA